MLESVQWFLVGITSFVELLEHGNGHQKMTQAQICRRLMKRVSQPSATAMSDGSDP